MRSPAAALLLAVVLVVAGTALFTAANEREAPRASPVDASAMSFDATVTSFDATPIAITVYRPANVDADAPVPVVLHSHGWSGSRTTDGSGLVGRLWEEGFGVVSVDARGHGESGGYAQVHHKDFEVRDFQAVLDWVHDNLDWVAKEPGSGIPKDIVAGGAGYSYGGAFQLMLASYDPRLDAITPQITWTSLPDALAPQGVPKSGWLDFLLAEAAASGTRVDPRVQGWFQHMLVENEIPPDALAHFEGSVARPEAIRAHTLYIQGVSDTLFPLNEAERALAGIRLADVRLLTHLTGHVIPYGQPFGTSLDRHGIFLDDGPCGNVSDAVVGWLDEKLRDGAPSRIPNVSYALESGECLVLGAPPSARVTREAAAGVLPHGAGTLLLPLGEGPLVIAGVPEFDGQVATGAPGPRAFAGLAVVGADGFVRIVNDQSVPVRADPAGRILVDLGGVATRLGEGDRLFLRVDGLNEWYLHNGERAPGATVLSHARVHLPVVA